MLPGRALTDGVMLRLALYGLVCALKIDDPTALGWIKRVIRDAGIDTAEFRANHEMNVATYRAKRQAPAADLAAALRRDGLL